MDSTIDVEVGSDVPLLVSPDGTKAVFDKKDPTINVVSVAKAEEEGDKDRFRRELEGDSAPSATASGSADCWTRQTRGFAGLG